MKLVYQPDLIKLLYPGQGRGGSGLLIPGMLKGCYSGFVFRTLSKLTTKEKKKKNLWYILCTVKSQATSILMCNYCYGYMLKGAFIFALPPGNIGHKVSHYPSQASMRTHAHTNTHFYTVLFFFFM